MSLYKKGIYFVVIASLLWGVSGVCAQFLFQRRGVDVQWLTAVRLICSGTLLLLWGCGRGEKKLLDVWKKEPLRLLSFAVFAMMPVQLTFFLTVNHSNAATATILQILSPIFVSGYLCLRNLALPSRILSLSILLSAAGTFLIATHGSFTSLSVSKAALFWGILSALASAFYTLYSIGIIKRNGALPVTGWAMLTGGVALSLLFPPWSSGGVWDVWACFSFLYIVTGSMTAFYLFLSGVQLIGGEKAIVLACVEPLAAALISMIFLGVRFAAPDYIGALAILSTVVILSKDRS